MNDQKVSRPTEDNVLPDLNQKRSIDISLVAGIFFIGISVGALIPVGMKFFGYWQKPAQVSQVEKTAKVKKEKNTVEPALAEAENLPESAPVAAPLETKTPVAEAALTPAHELKKAKILTPTTSGQVKTSSKATSKLGAEKTVSRGHIEAAVAERSLPTAVQEKSKALTESKALAQIAELEQKAAQARKKKTKFASKTSPDQESPILEELPEGPSAIEIQNLTAAYLAKNAGASSEKDGDAKTVAVAYNPPVPAKVAVNAPVPAVEAAAPQVEAQPADTVTATEEVKAPSALSINNASYTKNNLENCIKRCVLLGLDAFGMPIKAIINGPTFARSLLSHTGTINLSGQPRLIKNQQVLIVDNITFNLAPAAGAGDIASKVKAKDGSKLREASYSGSKDSKLSSPNASNK